MADHSAIEWTDATWNPIVGCSIVSPGCTNCYAMKMAARLQKMNRTGGSGTGFVNHYDGTTKVVNSNVVWSGKVALAPDHLFLAPLGWKKSKRIFVNSMGDLFHEDVPDEWIDKVFAVMALAPHHTFQVLTKRSKRMREYMATADADKLGLPEGEAERRDHIAVEAFCIREDTIDRNGNYTIVETDCFVNGERWPLPNVWLGVSAEDQRRADERIPDLLATPAAVRFVSAEPLLGPIDFTLRSLPGWDEDWKYDTLAGKEWANPRDDDPPASPRLNWIIVGGESGHGAREMLPRWARPIRDQCQAAGVPFFFKQWGEFAPDDPSANHTAMRRVGKSRAGRLLDGVEHNGMPEARA